MRVIAGKYRSRRLLPAVELDLRPTSDRLRETLFNVLTPGDPDALVGSTWLDLFAGTGAVGIEALSRGAAMVQFVESSPAATELIQKNLKTLGIGNGFQIHARDVRKALRSLAGPVSHVFVDPPYSMEKVYAETLEQLSKTGILNPDALVIAEHFKKFDPGDSFGNLRRYRTLAQGDAVLSFYRAP
jgi:16S rRNA (guanine(966)-N(2))-methyltransferase RsmD